MKAFSMLQKRIALLTSLRAGRARSHGRGAADQADRQRAVIRRVAAEALGTALLLAIVVGSGIMGEQLAAGNAAVALLANTIATGAGLFVLITIFAPISGAHFNPAVISCGGSQPDYPLKEALAYIAAQFVGAVVRRLRGTRDVRSPAASNQRARAQHVRESISAKSSQRSDCC